MTHWLESLAQRAALPGAERLALPPQASPAEAWAQVVSACGLTDDELAWHVARVSQCDVADLAAAESRAATFLTQSVAQRYLVFPLREDYRRLVVAVANPGDVGAEQAIGFASGRTPVLEVAPPAAIAAQIERAYASDTSVERLLHHLPDARRNGGVHVVEPRGRGAAPRARAMSAEAEALAGGELDRGPVIRLTDLILQDAAEKGASDIHIQPGDTGGVVKFRVDGLLRHYMYLPVPALQRVVSRIKVMARMDITDRLRPQDGRASVELAGRECDLRVSTVPTRGVEKAVIRILGGATGPTSLEDTGLLPDGLARLRGLLDHRQGIVIVTGPTGSGKTTTLYGALRELDNGEVNIMTVEDPVEYELPGLTQIQVEPRQGVTFASALRAILRQDPDIILVGEIRDPETADTAVQASRTGHLVLATLHTNDAVGTIARLGDLGLDGAAISDTLRGVLSQRLMRRVCSACAAPIAGPLTAEEAALARQYGMQPVVRARGCKACDGTGYRGRILVAEILVMEPALAALVSRSAPPQEIERAAVAAGMTSILENALERVRRGDTTLDEAHRVLGVSEDGHARHPVADTAGELVVDETVAAAAASAEPAMPEATSGAAPRVLLVDDDGTVRTIARALLERAGYTVAEADNGEDGLRMLREDVYGLLVLDLSMPRMDGRAVLRAVRGDINTAGLPVIVLTGSDGEQAEVELMDMGADDYIRKPIDPPRFVTRVRATLRRALG